jgi:hypothetical protein
VVTVNPIGIVLLGNVTNGSGSFTDADFAGDTFTATVDYGDGSGTTALTLTGTTFALRHRYSSLLGSFQVTVTVTDSEGMSGTGTTTVTVIL